MCGKEEPALYKAVIEGAVMNVCSGCASTGEIIKKPELKVEFTDKKREQRGEEPETAMFIVSSDFAENVKSAREKQNLTQEKLGEAIAEKISVIQSVEAGKLTPSLKLARKFEQFLHVRLIEEYKEKPKEKNKIDFKSTTLTIGDLLKIKKEQGKEE